MANKLMKFNDVAGYLIKLNVGDAIPGERDLADIIGYSRANIREILNHFEGKGFLKIAHGKPTLIVKSFAELDLTDFDGSDKSSNFESTLFWILERAKEWPTMSEQDMKAALSAIEDETAAALDN